MLQIEIIDRRGGTGSNVDNDTDPYSFTNCGVGVLFSNDHALNSESPLIMPPVTPVITGSV